MDPVLIYLVSLSLSLLFATAGIHKLWHPTAFRQVLSGYQLLPLGALGLAGRAVPIAELTIALGLIIPQTQFLAAIATVVVLLGYAAAIWINIVRGNLALDCGCQLGTARQTISMALVIRNFILAIATLIIILPSSERILTTLDYGFLTFGLVIAALLYATLNTQIANATSYREINS